MTSGAGRSTAWLSGAALVLLTAVSGCTSGGGRSIDGSCWDGQTRITSVDGGTGRATWSRVLKHPREDRPEATSDAVLVRGCGIVVLATADGRRLHRQHSEHGIVGLAESSLVTRDRNDSVTVTPPDRDPPYGLSSTPPYDLVAVAGDDLIVGLDSQLTAYGMPPSGRPRWRITVPGADEATLTAAAGVLVVHSNGSLYRVDPESGEIAWRVIPTPPALSYGAVLSLDGTTAVVESGLERDDDGSRTIVGVDLDAGAERWRARVARESSGDSGPVIVGGVVVLPTEAADGREVVAFDLSDGRVLWRRPGVAEAPAAAGDVVVVDDEVAAVALDPRTGEERWRVPTQHQPLLAAVPGTDQVLVLDSPPVAHGSNDCC